MPTKKEPCLRIVRILFEDTGGVSRWALVVFQTEDEGINEIPLKRPEFRTLSIARIRSVRERTDLNEAATALFKELGCDPKKIPMIHAFALGAWNLRDGNNFQ